jgi:hypothetical protein
MTAPIGNRPHAVLKREPKQSGGPQLYTDHRIASRTRRTAAARSFRGTPWPLSSAVGILANRLSSGHAVDLHRFHPRFSRSDFV